MKQLHYSSLVTNASLNRDAAVRMFKAGMSPADIARAFPKVFTCTDGKLGQIYDSEIADGSGRLETRYTILKSAVDAAIKRHKSR